MTPRWTMVGFFFLLLSSTAAFSAFAQTSAPASPQSPQYNSGPVTDYNSAVPNGNDNLRFRRGERYNIPISSLPELGEDSEATLWDLPETHFKKDLMPFEGSDAVVVGAVTSGQAYLSNDKRSIYSEFKLKVREVVKTTGAMSLRADDSIEIQRKGGAIRLRSGKVLVRGALADSMPQIGKRYLLFLKYNQDTDDFAIVTGYQLDGNEVYRLDDLSYGESNHKKVFHSLRKEGVTEDQFLDRLVGTRCCDCTLCQQTP
jgi:hypothetical protein